MKTDQNIVPKFRAPVRMRSATATVSLIIIQNDQRDINIYIAKESPTTNNKIKSKIN